MKWINITWEKKDGKLLKKLLNEGSIESFIGDAHEISAETINGKNYQIGSERTRHGDRYRRRIPPVQTRKRKRGNKTLTHMYELRKIFTRINNFGLCIPEM
ncbi:hypothetical protein AKJ65_02705 [candidate division MSBL1 archaeon SCGC-AAA259E19]|uniref:Uncharacterized protein n=2 Tax=candidate division MSBL1 TaxID=215777 RepID=A0A133UA91_9EURY|nr:hypothetical protein AKJ64_04960 [candidate division MSBL1 archaeon SCGC-AAA259E17]KXA95044.1 hypothetical protein AKJ65_02705 [candidate division MSBL1 archaeon SCGC-AAA259E19]